MRRNQDFFCWILFCVLVGVNTISFFGSPALPTPDHHYPQLILLEDADKDLNHSLIRSVSETQGESTRQSHLIHIAFVEIFHSERESVQRAQILDKENAQRPWVCIYLNNSCFTI